MQHNGVERAIFHLFNWHKTMNLVARNRDVIEIMRGIPLFIPLHEHVPQNERWEEKNSSVLPEGLFSLGLGFLKVWVVFE